MHAANFAKFSQFPACNYLNLSPREATVFCFGDNEENHIKLIRRTDVKTELFKGRE